MNTYILKGSPSSHDERSTMNIRPRKLSNRIKRIYNTQYLTFVVRYRRFTPIELWNSSTQRLGSLNWSYSRSVEEEGDKSCKRQVFLCSPSEFIGNGGGGLMTAYCRLYITANNYQFASRRRSFLKTANVRARMSADCRNLAPAAAAATAAL